MKKVPLEGLVGLVGLIGSSGTMFSFPPASVLRGVVGGSKSKGGKGRLASSF